VERLLHHDVSSSTYTMSSTNKLGRESVIFLLCVLTHTDTFRQSISKCHYCYEKKYTKTG